MGTFNFHIVAHDLKTDADDLATKFAKVLANAGKVVDSIVYTDDNGTREIRPVIAAAASVAAAAVPAAAPAISEAEKIASNIPADLDKLETEVKDVIEKI